MTIIEYLEHMIKAGKKVEEIEKENIREDPDDESTIYEAINKMLRSKDIEKKC